MKLQSIVSFFAPSAARHRAQTETIQSTGKDHDVPLAYIHTPLRRDAFKPKATSYNVKEKESSVPKHGVGAIVKYPARLQKAKATRHTKKFSMSKRNCKNRA